MRKATVRDLRYDFPKVEAWIAEGEPIEITKRGRVVAQLIPPPKARRKKAVQWPDIMARLKSNFGDKVLPVSGAELIREERDRGF